MSFGIDQGRRSNPYWPNGLEQHWNYPAPPPANISGIFLILAPLYTILLIVTLWEIIIVYVFFMMLKYNLTKTVLIVKITTIMILRKSGTSPITTDM